LRPTVSDAVTRWARPALVLAGLAVVGYLLARVGPLAVWNTISTLGWRLLLVLLVPYMLVVVLDTLGWQVLFHGAHVPFSVLLRVRLAGEAVNLTTPTASVGGEPVKAYLLRPYMSLADAFAVIIVDKTTVVAGQSLFLVAGLAAGTRLLPPSSTLMTAMILLLVVEIVALAGFILVQMRGVFGGSGRILARLGLTASSRYQTGLESLDDALAMFYRKRRGRLLASAALHAAGWATNSIEVYLVLTWLDLSASPLAAFVIESFAAAVKFASFMVPANLGVLEGGYIAFFAALGFSGAVGLSFTLIRRLREAVWGALGFLALASLRARPSAS